jgi:hypothetical protein
VIVLLATVRVPAILQENVAVEPIADYRDFTKKLGSGQCRYQAIRSADNHYITHNDGPEPNPQPAYFCNGNPDLILPWGCVKDTIEEWHEVC